MYSIYISSRFAIEIYEDKDNNYNFKQNCLKHTVTECFIVWIKTIHLRSVHNNYTIHLSIQSRMCSHMHLRLPTNIWCETRG